MKFFEHGNYQINPDHVTHVEKIQDKPPKLKVHFSSGKEIEIQGVEINTFTNKLTSPLKGRF